MLEVLAVRASNGNLLPKDLCQPAMGPRTVVVSAPTPWQATVDLCLCWRLPDTHWQVYFSLLWDCCFFPLVLVHIWFCLFPPRASVSRVLWKFSNQILLCFKVRFPGDFQSLWQIPWLESLKWGLELSQQCNNFFGIIVLQLVGHPPSRYGVWFNVIAPLLPSHYGFSFYV